MGLPVDASVNFIVLLAPSGTALKFAERVGSGVVAVAVGVDVAVDVVVVVDVTVVVDVAVAVEVAVDVAVVVTVGVDVDVVVVPVVAVPVGVAVTVRVAVPFTRSSPFISTPEVTSTNRTDILPAGSGRKVTPDSVLVRTKPEPV